MAGPWLKMECSTPDKPQVLAITGLMGWTDPDVTVGKLFRLWRWFDQHTVEGNAVGVTPALLDGIVGVTGFVAALAKVGWVLVSEDGVTLSNFTDHNGETAKQRAQTAKRVADHRTNAKGNGEGNATSVTEGVPRGRGRSNTSSLRSEVSAFAPARPDGVTERTWADWLHLRHKKKAPVTETVVTGAVREAEKAGMSVEAFLQVWVLRGTQGLMAEWLKPSERSSASAKPSRHSGFNEIDYRDGVNEDGSF